jgi:hypothetical protein
VQDLLADPEVLEEVALNGLAHVRSRLPRRLTLIRKVDRYRARGWPGGRAPKGKDDAGRTKVETT